MKRLPILFILILMSGSLAFGAVRPKVAVSIKPLHSLLSNILLGIAEPQLIVSAAGSPHGYNLRPSEARALQQAELIVWVGPELESFMVKPLANIAPDTPRLTLLHDLPELTIYPARSGGQWATHHDHEHTHDHLDTSDPHLWLSPKNAAIITRAVTQKLVAIDPANSSRYQQNRDLLLSRLLQLDRKINRRLAGFKQVKYIVFHDAYQYFEKEYQLSPVGALAIDPERRPGARRLAELKKTIETTKVVAVFSEPQFEPRLVRILTEGTTLRTGILDPLGADLAPGVDHYFALMEQLTTALEKGLAGE